MLSRPGEQIRVNPPSLNVQTSAARAVAWVWRCPHCQARVLFLSEQGGLTGQHLCRHVILYRRSVSGVEVRFADAE